MKKIIILILVIFAGYYLFNNSQSKVYRVSEIIQTNNVSEYVTVTGHVRSNFKLFFGVYELEDINSGESIMVSTKGDLPKVGSAITVKLKRNDVITINDKTFSLFEEVK